HSRGSTSYTLLIKIAQVMRRFLANSLSAACSSWSEPTGLFFSISLDRLSGELFIRANAGEHLPDSVIMAPKINQLLIVKGTRKDPVKHVSFKNITFSHSSWSLPETGYAGIQAACYGSVYGKEPTHMVEPAIYLVFAEKCKFEDCVFTHLGAGGLGLGAGCRHNVVLNCKFDDIGANGIVTGWRGTEDRGPRMWFDNDWPHSDDIPEDNHVEHCEVQRCGQICFGAVAIFDAFTKRSQIVFNEVSDCPYSGISVGFRWDTTKTSHSETYVAFNHIHNVMKFLADGGGIYTLGWQPGTVLQGNLIHDIHRSAYAFGGAPNNGIFFDEGSKGLTVRENIIYNTSGEPIRFNQCQKEWMEWEDNYFNISPNDPDFPREKARRAGPAGREN
ncbi:hypothetical protein GF407_20245, partial [candidate division KSB1 bacterium]|nr:hypothetical protein [candidate division KSB1 bacterium]